MWKIFGILFIDPEWKKKCFQARFIFGQWKWNASNIFSWRTLDICFRALPQAVEKKQAPDPDVSSARKDAAWVYAEAKTPGEVQSDGILGAGWSGENWRFASFGERDDEARKLFHRRWDLFDCGKAQIAGVSKSFQKSLFRD